MATKTRPGTRKGRKVTREDLELPHLADTPHDGERVTKITQTDVENVDADVGVNATPTPELTTPVEPPPVETPTTPIATPPKEPSMAAVVWLFLWAYPVEILLSLTLVVPFFLRFTGAMGEATSIALFWTQVIILVSGRAILSKIFNRADPGRFCRILRKVAGISFCLGVVITGWLWGVTDTWYLTMLGAAACLSIMENVFARYSFTDY